MNNQNFTHLRLHSEYSLSDGTIRFKKLFPKLLEMGQKSVALTDLNNIYGLVKFYKQAVASGIKPILGAEVSVRYDDGIFNLILLCKNDTGYKNLCEIISLAYLKGQINHTLGVSFEDLKANTSGLIALSAGTQGIIGNYILNNKKDEAINLIQEHKLLFDNEFYIEVSQIKTSQEANYFSQALEIAQITKTPAVATNHSCFLKKDEFEAHEARVCISGGMLLDDQNRDKNYTNEQYLKSYSQMSEVFENYPDLLKNSNLIAQKCNVKLIFGESYLPDFPNEFNLKEDEYLIKLAKEGLEKRLKQLFKTESEIEKVRKTYEDRLDFEINTINQMGFPGYFLIVADFIDWSKENDIPVGPGRGSGAGSLVAYSLKITDLDPLKYNLLFERFLNPERVSMPDFDIDFCMDKRDLVIEYVAQKYGTDKVSQIATHGTMAAKAVIRDVGRVLGNGYGFVDSLAKLIPFEIGMTLTKALEIEPELAKRYETDEEVKTLLNLALSLEGLARNVGKHAGGVVISPTKLTDFSAIYCEQDSKSIIVQYDKNDIEAVGLVKFDFLGLKTLTVIDWAIKIINSQNKVKNLPNLDIAEIDLADKKTYTLLKKQQTTAVFQLESSGMKDLIKRLEPDTFEEIIALVALFRPGPLQSGMVDDFINVKHKRAEANYPHPDLEEILEPTYGVILYQEQVMQIAQILASFSLGQADMLRRAMGKKKPEEMEKQRELFLSGAEKNKIDKTKATYIFDLMEKFAGYGFNKSHSAAYALLAYQTAWLKTHHAEAFMSAVMSADMDNTEKVVIMVEECKDLKLCINNPCINNSFHKFSVNDNNEIVYGLGAIKGVGEAAIKAITDFREENGLFKNIDSFFSELDFSKINKRTLEALIKAGAFDCLNKNRKYLLDNIERYSKLASQKSKDRKTGQKDLFGNFTSATKVEKETEEDCDYPFWSEKETLDNEKISLGIYLSGHPFDSFKHELLKITGRNLRDVLQTKQTSNRQSGKFSRAGTPIWTAGLVTAVRVKQGKKSKMAFMTIDDCSEKAEIRFFNEAYENNKEKLINDKIVIIKGSLVFDEFASAHRINAEQVFTIDEARKEFAKAIQIEISTETSSEIDLEKQNTEDDKIKNIISTLESLNLSNDGATIFIKLNKNSIEGRLKFPQTKKIEITQSNYDLLINEFGKDNIKINYSTI